MFWRLAHLGNYFCDPPRSRTTETKIWKWRTDVRPCCFVESWILWLRATDTGGFGQKGRIPCVNAPCLDLGWWAQGSCIFSRYPKALGVGGRHKNGAKILTLAWNLDSWVQSKTWGHWGWIWKRQNTTQLSSHNQPVKTRPTRQSRGSSHQSFHTSSKPVLEISPNIAYQSVFTTTHFLC